MKKEITFSILLVEDDSDDRVIIDEAFVEIGYECEIKKFHSGNDLLSYLEKIDQDRYPSLIVLDNVLPGLNGSDILGILKQNEAYKDIPVIVYTTSCTPSKTAELKALGAYDCVEKGNTMQAIIETAKKFRNVSRADIKDTPMDKK
jgi:CheY-like chemotaxis protein